MRAEKRYYKDICRYLSFGGRKQCQYTQPLRRALREHMEEFPDETYEGLETQFGRAEEVARGIAETVPEELMLVSGKRRRNLVIACGVIVVLAAVLVWFVGTYGPNAKYKVLYVETEINELESIPEELLERYEKIEEE